MITDHFVKTFSKEWVDAWNSREIERIMGHYAEDFIIESPRALEIVPESRGKIFGRDLVRKYWETGLRKNPELHFKLIDVLKGIECVTIYYSNTSTGRIVCESMFFDSKGKVTRAFVSHSTGACHG